MCVNYVPVSRATLETHFQAPIQDEFEWKTETWQDYLAPIIIGRNEQRICELAAYSMVPKKHMSPSVKRYSTMNARAETIGTLRSFAKFWCEGKLCLVPMIAFMEPNYESGKAERWKIGMVDGAPFAVAGVYRTWPEADGGQSFAFTQITINADDHPLMRRMHKPDDEKRSLVIVPPDAYDDWLSCKNPEMARAYLRAYPAARMHAEQILKR